MLCFLISNWRYKYLAPNIFFKANNQCTNVNQTILVEISVSRGITITFDRSFYIFVFHEDEYSARSDQSTDTHLLQSLKFYYECAARLIMKTRSLYVSRQFDGLMYDDDDGLFIYRFFFSISLFSMFRCLIL